MLSRFLIVLYCNIFTVLSIGAQTTPNTKNHFQLKLIENQQLLISNAEKGMVQLDSLLKIAKREEDRESQLILLGRKSWYFTNKDLKKAMENTQRLHDYAVKYKSTLHQAVAHQYFATIYVRSDLPEKALTECLLSIHMFNEINDTKLKDKVAFHKANTYNIANEIYRYKKDSNKAIGMLLKANKEIDRLQQSETKRLMFRANYTNLGISYAEKESLDSAEYYIKKSVLLTKEEEKNDLLQLNNEIFLGYIYKARKDYNCAIYYYKKAENKLMILSATHENINHIYRNLAEIYKHTDSLRKANDYLQKLQNSVLESEVSKNKSLHKIIDEELLKNSNSTFYISAGSGLLLLIMAIFMIRLYRKNTLLKQQERASEVYLEETAMNVPLNNDTLSELFEMVHRRNPAFMILFQNVFPGFMEKLQKIHPQIVQTELEFCAMMKLNLSTKEIARILNIEPKSVQAKKYRIRKKLNIQKNVDIYKFFNEF